MNTELSVITSSLRALGERAPGWRANSVLTAVAVLVTLAAACFVTVMPTASLPLTRERRVCSLKPSTTVATSRTRTLPPGGEGGDHRALDVAGERNLASTRRL